MPGAAASRARLAARQRQQPSSTANNTSGDISKYAYVEVMACPGGCTNGGGQIKVGDVPALRSAIEDATTSSSPDNINQNHNTTVLSLSSPKNTVVEQREWLGQVDEAYFSSSNDDHDLGHDSTNPNHHHLPPSPPKYDQAEYITNGERRETQIINGLNIPYLRSILDHWSSSTGIPLDKLTCTTYRAVDSDVGKAGKNAEDGTQTERVVEALAGKIGGGW